jgi:hypothetical protein
MKQPNEALRRARERTPSPSCPEECLSRQELAELVNAHVWEHHQIRVETDANYIGKLERARIGWPSAQYRQALRHLLAAPSDAALGLINRRRTVVRLPEVGREQFLRGAAVGVSGVLLRPRPTGRDVAGWTEVLEIEGAISDLRRADQWTGGDLLLSTARRLVRDVEHLLSLASGSDLITRLYKVLGEAHVLAGWLAHDGGDPSSADRSYSDALSAAQLAEDPLLTAHVCSNLSMLMSMTGRASNAVHCSQAGLRAAAAGDGGPRLRALLLAREASAHARLSDPRAADAAMGKSVDALGSTGGRDPGWVIFLSEAELSGINGEARRRLGQHDTAIDQLTVAAQTAAHPRNASSWQMALARAHLAAGDIDTAASVASGALTGVVRLSSARVRGRVTSLLRSLDPFAYVPAVGQLRDVAEQAGLVA